MVESVKNKTSSIRSPRASFRSAAIIAAKRIPSSSFLGIDWDISLLREVSNLQL